jgi:hypothetical protein
LSSHYKPGDLVSIVTPREDALDDKGKIFIIDSIDPHDGDVYPKDEEIESLGLHDAYYPDELELVFTI